MAKPWSPEQAERGRALVRTQTNAKWELGDLILEIVPIGTRGKRAGQIVVIEAFAHEINIAPQTLRAYRHVAAKIPPQLRIPNMSFNAHQHLSVLRRDQLVKALDHFMGARPKTITEVERYMRQHRPPRQTSQSGRSVQSQARMLVDKSLRYAERATELLGDEPDKYADALETLQGVETALGELITLLLKRPETSRKLVAAR